MLKVCIAGLGSIGQRHLRNLVQVLRAREKTFEIHALRKEGAPLPGDVEALLQRQVFSVEDLDGDYDVFFVTGPTSCHAGMVRKAVGISRNLFIEKPLFQSSETTLESIDWRPDGVYHVACPLRFSPVYDHLRRHLPARVLSVRALCSSYLPEWRPGRDYSRTYSASAEMGGGVRLDLIHELDYIVSLFGFPRRVVSMSGKYSCLRLNSEDLAVYLAEYPDFLAEVHLDYFGRVPRREIEILSEEEVSIYDFVGQCCRHLRQGTRIDLSRGGDMYVAEMEHFIGCVLSGEKTVNGHARAYRLLEVVEG